MDENTKMSRAIENRGIYILGLLAVFIAIIINNDTLIILFGPIKVELINLIKISFFFLLVYCLFEIVAYSEDLFGKSIAEIGRFVSRVFLTMIFFLSGVFFVRVTLAIYKDTIIKFSISFLVLMLLVSLPNLQKFFERIKKDSISEIIKSKWNNINFTILITVINSVLLGGMFITSDKFVNYFWVGSLVCLLLLAASIIHEMH